MRKQLSDRRRRIPLSPKFFQREAVSLKTGFLQSKKMVLRAILKPSVLVQVRSPTDGLSEAIRDGGAPSSASMSSSSLPSSPMSRQLLLTCLSGVGAGAVCLLDLEADLLEVLFDEECAELKLDATDADGGAKRKQTMSKSEASSGECASLR